MENNNFNQSEDITDTDFEEYTNFENDDNYLQSQAANQEHGQSDDYTQNQGSDVSQNSEVKAKKQSLFSKIFPFESKKTEPVISESERSGAAESRSESFVEEISEVSESVPESFEAKVFEPEVPEVEISEVEVSAHEVSAFENSESNQDGENEYVHFDAQNDVQEVIRGSIQWNEQNNFQGGAGSGVQEAPNGNVQLVSLQGNYPYPPDEFDAPYESPVGIHRKPVTVRTYLLPILVAILAGIIVAASVFFLVYKGTFFIGSPESDSDATSSATVTATDTTAPTSPSTSPSTDTPEPEESPDVAAPVAIFNASEVIGLAAHKASILTEAGYTDVTSGNWALDTPPSQDTVYYANDEEKATADDIAKKLDITDVVLKDYGNNEINVVIVSGQ